MNFYRTSCFFLNRAFVTVLKVILLGETKQNIKRVAINIHKGKSKKPIYYFQRRIPAKKEDLQEEYINLSFQTTILT